MVKFLVSTAGLALFFIVLLSVSLEAGWLEQSPSFFYPALILVAATTIVIYLYLYRIANPSQFVQLFLLLMVLKLVACLAFALIMVLRDQAGAARNVTCFIVFYVSFTAVEIAFLYFRKPPGKSF